MAEFGKHRHVDGADPARAVGRHIEEEGGVAANALSVDGEEFLSGADGVVLGAVMEPAGADRGVDFGRVPDQVVLVACKRGAGAEIVVAAVDLSGELAVVSLLGDGGGALGVLKGAGDNAPLLRTGMTGLVSAPANVRSADADDGVGLMFADEGVIAVPVVELLGAGGSLAVGAVEPEREDRTIGGQELGELGDVDVVVGGARAVGGVIAIPR